MRPGNNVGFRTTCKAGVHIPGKRLRIRSGSHRLRDGDDSHTGRADVVVAGEVEAAIHGLPYRNLRIDEGALDTQ
jgi:hypothetical protein